MTAPTPPCLGEREAVARTEEREAIRLAFLTNLRVGSYAGYDSMGDYYPSGYTGEIKGIEEAVGAIIAEHIAPLRTENETLTAKLAQAEGEIATMRRAFFKVSMIQARELRRLDPHGNTPPDLDAAMADLRTALTSPEHPHGD